MCTQWLGFVKRRYVKRSVPDEALFGLYDAWASPEVDFLVALEVFKAAEKPILA